MRPSDHHGTPLGVVVSDLSDRRGRQPKSARRRWKGLSLGWLGTLADWIQIVGGLIAVLALVVNQPARQAILAIFLCFLTATAVWQVFALSRQLAVQAEKHLVNLENLETAYARRNRTIDALVEFSEAARYMSRATVAGLDGSRRTEFLLLAEEGAQRLARAFTTATGSTCRVTLKEIYAHQPGKATADTLAVRTLCASGEPETGRVGVELNRTDLVVKNTDFYRIILDNRPFYMCNDIPQAVADGKYENSHFTTMMAAARDYPYRSTLCWPVGNRRDADFDLQGFLCVDSPDTDVFDSTQDAAMGQTFAHSLYAGMRAFRQVNVQPPASSGSVGTNALMHQPRGQE